MDPKLRFLFFLASGICFLIAALGGTRKGAAGQPAVLVPLGLLLFIVPTIWDAWNAAF